MLRSMRISLACLLSGAALSPLSASAWAPPPTTTTTTRTSAAAAAAAFRRSSPGNAKKHASTSTAAYAIAIPLTGASSIDTTEEAAAVAAVPVRSPLDPQDSWVAALDYEAFGKEVSALGKELMKEGGQADVDHLNKMVAWRNACAVVGCATLWLPPNPLTVLALSTWTYSSWTMIAHHTCHGGYNRMDASDFNSRGFALGSVAKRVRDWLDWMHPEAWNIEHNRHHHYRLNEEQDPDLVQRNLDWLRDANVPLAAKYATIAFFAPTWKWLYYAPNTWKELEIARMKKEGRPLPEGFNPAQAVTVGSLFMPDRDSVLARQVIDPVGFFTKVLGPFFLLRFVALPALFLAVPGIGPALALNALVNTALAELVTNMHAFLTIVTNHAGEDLYTFDDAVKPKTPSFYVRQIVGSANYALGSDAVDFFHGWLNYQVEHHVWPDLSMLQYQRAAPRLRAICDKHGVPYVQESVFERLRKTVDIMVGKATMRRFPVEYEPAKDKAPLGVVWKSTNGAIDGDESGV